MQRKVILNNDLITFQFNYDAEIIKVMKEAMAKFDPKTRYWYVEKSKPMKVNFDFLAKLSVQYSFFVEAAVFNHISKFDKKYIVISKDKKYLLFYFPYDEQIIDFLKKNCFVTYKKPQRAYDRPHWEAPISALSFVFDNAKFFKKHNFKISSDLFNMKKRVYRHQKGAIAHAPLEETDWSPYVPAGKILYPFQQAGVQHIWRKNNRVLLGDEMGLGKCILGDSWVVMNNSILKIEDLWDKTQSIIYGDPNTGTGEWKDVGHKSLRTISLTEKGKIVQGKIDRLYRENITNVPIKVIQTQDTLPIRTTLKHKFLTPKGWKANIEEGDFIATPLKTVKTKGNALDSRLVRFMAGLISDKTTKILIKHLKNLKKSLQNKEYVVKKKNGRGNKYILQILKTIDCNYLDEVISIIEYLLHNEVRWTKVTKAYIETYSGWVYDLEIKEYHNYIANNLITHNTVQAIVSVNKDYENKTPILIVCPNSAKYVWKRHLKDWLLKYNSDKISFVTADNKAIKDDSEIVIINFDLLGKLEKKLKDMKFKTLIIDEVHHTRNTTRPMPKKEFEKLQKENPDKKLKRSVPVKRTKTIMDIGKGLKNIIAISGTPIVNKPIELFNVLKLLDPITFSNKNTYAKMFCDFRVLRFGKKTFYDSSGASNLKQLHELLTATIMIRRNKKDVLKELPDKIRTVIPLEYNSASDRAKMDKEIKALKGEAVTIIDENKIGSSLKLEGKKILFSMVAKLWERTFKYKFKQAQGFLDDILEQKDKVVIFVYHREAYHMVEEYLKKKKIKYTGILGGTPDKERGAAEQDFQNKKDVRVFLGTIGAAKESLTLTASSDVVFLELDWVPGNLNQAEDRCHRIGQEGSVNVYYIVLNESIDVNMVKLVMDKIDIIAAAISGKNLDEDVKSKDGINSMFNQFVSDYINHKALNFNLTGDQNEF